MNHITTSRIASFQKHHLTDHDTTPLTGPAATRSFPENIQSSNTLSCTNLSLLKGHSLPRMMPSRFREQRDAAGLDR